jgi:Na+/proline symporter
MLFMAVTSTGSAELIAVSSLFSYDLYRWAGSTSVSTYVLYFIVHSENPGL